MGEYSRLLVAFVALKSARQPVQDEVVALMREKYTAEPVPTPGQANETSAFFDLPEGVAVSGLMPGPIPWGDLEWPCRSAFWWPNAEEVLRKHTHHLIVSLADAPGTPIERHVWITKFVAALAESSDAVGIYWGSGAVVHKPETFCELAVGLSAAAPFPRLWIDHHIWQDGATIKFATSGLRAFDILEVEVAGSSLPAEELYQFCCNFVTYVLGYGKTIPDGNTIGRSATEKFRVRHAPSLWERDGPVMRLEMS